MVTYRTDHSGPVETPATVDDRPLTPQQAYNLPLPKAGPTNIFRPGGRYRFHPAEGYVLEVATGTAYSRI